MGLILNKKLSCKLKIEDSVRKALVALYCSRGAIRKKKGISSEVELLLASVVVNSE